MEFAYVAFTDNNPLYMKLLKIAIESVLFFSKYPFIVYLVNIPIEKAKSFFPVSESVIYRHINFSLPSIYYYKPWIIIDAIKQGLKTGYYIESDDVITPLCDTLKNKATLLTDLPLSPIHPKSDHKPSQQLMRSLGVVKNTQSYVHAHVLFKDTNMEFLREWFDACLKIRGENWDESALNCMYWKRGCTEHYMELNDPFYETFYTNTETRLTACTYHGCKDSVIQEKLFIDMKACYKLIVELKNKTC